MDEIKEKDDDILLKIVLFLFVIFLILYICNETGIYENKAHNKMNLTNEALKEFEKDVSDGKDVSLKDYVKNEKIDYSNKVSDLGYNIGKITEKIMNEGIKKTLKLISALFYK